MDQELKQYLETKFGEERAAAKQDVVDMAGQILHEMGARFAETNATLHSIDARLKLQAGLIQAGSRAMARFSAFSENSEERWVALEKRIADLERRAS